ncbi:high mobility group box domain-containing protein [Phycomyces nitens]|nr:high mobility group box domain-containing protein [Phycomyces nitens]
MDTENGMVEQPSNSRRLNAGIEDLGVQCSQLKTQLKKALQRQESLQVDLRVYRNQVRRLRNEKDILLDEIERNRMGPSFDDSSASDTESLRSHTPISGIKRDRLQYENGYNGQSSLGKTLGHLNKPVKKRRSQKGANATQPTRTKKKKDPNAPKGPGNPFFLYCRMERDRIKGESDHDMNLGEMTRVLGQEWKALDAKEKQKYLDLFKKEHDEYEEALRSYTASTEAGDQPSPPEAHSIASTGTLDEDARPKSA